MMSKIKAAWNWFMDEKNDEFIMGCGGIAIFATIGIYLVVGAIATFLL